MKVELIAICTDEMPDQQRGKKVFGFVAGKKFQRTNIAAAYVDGEIIAECLYNYATDGEVFNAWME
jgi:hypothetical protein